MKTTLKIVAGIAIFFFFIYLGAYMMSPGSYSRAEYYQIDIPCDQIKEKVAEFKEKYPNCKVYKLDENGLSYEFVSKNPESFFLYLPSLKITVISRISCKDGTCRIGLLNAEGESIPGRSQRLNSGKIPRKLNQKIKKVFEEEFLDRMGKWEHVNTGNSFFGLYF